MATRTATKTARRTTKRTTKGEVATGGRTSARGRVSRSPGSRSRKILEGSCQCGKVQFTVESETPVPFMFCFCSICRKTGGAAFGCNIMGIRETLRVTGRRFMVAYHARIREPGQRARIGEGTRWFCRACGTHLYITDDRWDKGVWPYVSAIDTPLPEPPQITSMMTRNKPSWVPRWFLAHGPSHAGFAGESIAAWHQQRGWPVTVTP